MEHFSKDLVIILQYLLPGFISAWIFYAFTSYPKPSQFERVIQALIFTVFIQALVHIIKSVSMFIGQFYAISCWNETSNWASLVICGILFGFVFTYYANNDKFHCFLRRHDITKETSYASEWFGTFLKNVTYVVLHFDDERRLYGWPIEWPSEPHNGHFLLAEASWLADDKEIPITGVEYVLVDAKHVVWVEFMTKTWEAADGQKGIESTPT